MSTETIDLADYAHDPATAALLALLRQVASWPADQVEGVAQVLDDLTLVCATRQAPEARLAGQFLTGTRRVLRGLSGDFEPGRGGD